MYHHLCRGGGGGPSSHSLKPPASRELGCPFSQFPLHPALWQAAPQSGRWPLAQLSPSAPRSYIGESWELKPGLWSVQGSRVLRSSVMSPPIPIGGWFYCYFTMMAPRFSLLESLVHRLLVKRIDCNPKSDLIPNQSLFTTVSPNYSNSLTL